MAYEQLQLHCTECGKFLPETICYVCGAMRLKIKHAEEDEKKYSVLFPKTELIDNLSAIEVLRYFPELDMGLFSNFAIKELVFKMEKGGIITITRK